MIQTISVVAEGPEDTVVSLTPDHAAELSKDFDILIEQNAGLKAGYSDKLYEDSGATILRDRQEVISKGDIILTYRSYTSIEASEQSKVIIGCHPVRDDAELLIPYTNRPVSLFSLDLLPRTSIAQSMDVLTSLASISGYQAVMTGLQELSVVAPMISGAGGTLHPAKVLVLGAGVAGLQAIANAKRMGALVYAFDVREQTREQVESVGASFIQINGANTDSASGGYAIEQQKEFALKVQHQIECIIPTFDLVICTAKVPGKKAPVLITEKAVGMMKEGSVIVDLAASTGGNCELTNRKTRISNNVQIIDGSQLFNRKAQSSSILLSQNILNFINYYLSKYDDVINDSILNSTLVLENGVLKRTDLISNYKIF